MNSQLQDLFEKIGKNAPLTPVEQIRLRREIQNIEEVVSVFKGLLDPGTSMLQVDNVKIANNDIHMNEFGIFFKNQEGEIGFQNTAKTGYDLITIFSDALDNLTFQNQVGGVGILVDVDSLTHKVMQLTVFEDPAIAERLQLLMSAVETGGQGSIINLENKIFIVGEGISGGYTAINMMESPDPTGVESLVQDQQARIYVRDNKLIIQWNDAGTNRYKYLDLTGTGVTWVHTTVAP